MKKSTSKKSRVNFRIDTALLKWGKKHAKQNGTNLTHIFISHLKALKEKSETVEG